jgi:hypothetical protein
MNMSGSASYRKSAVSAARLHLQRMSCGLQSIKTRQRRRLMNLTDRLAKINANRMQLQARIQRKSLRHESISYDQAKLIRETVKAIKAEMKLEKERAA